MKFTIKVTTNVGFGDEVHYVQRDFERLEDAKWWCDINDIDHEFESVHYEVTGEER